MEQGATDARTALERAYANPEGPTRHGDEFVPPTPPPAGESPPMIALPAPPVVLVVPPVAVPRPTVTNRDRNG
jgi:hypothetical protein